MKQHATFLACAAALALGGCGAAAQSRARPQVAAAQCEALHDVDRQVEQVYGAGQIARVEPLHRQRFVARAVQPKYVAGARLYVPAQQGFSAPYLDRVLSCHAAASTSAHANDPLRAPNIESIAVVPSGQHFVVTIAGRDQAAGREIYQRARSLVEPEGQVEVRQLSDASDPRANL
jgi:hypothetical protein